MRTKKKIKPGTVIVYILLIGWAVTTIFPFLWVFNNSFKPSAEVIRSSFSLPQEFTWMNYTNAFGKQNILKAYKNSLLISGSVTVGVMLLSSMMAFGLTRYRFRGKGVVQMLLSASLMFPVFSG